MTLAWFDCFSGASGDMILGALLDAGLSLDRLRDALAALRLSGYSLSAAKVSKQGLAATKFDVILAPDAPRPHRHLRHIREIIETAALPERVRDRAVRVFTRLAEAEALVHGTTVEKVHFHEVGAIDAIVDVVGACAALDALGVDRIVCSPIPVGSGAVRCEHGEMPIPAPATAILLRGVPLAACDEVGELTTPTGAAILTTLAESFGPLPAVTIRAVGLGAGTRDGQHRPNVLRVLLGDAAPRGGDDGVDDVTVLETNLDDATGQVIGHLCERLLAAGALDVFTTAIGMKKGRPGTMITILARPADADALETLLFAESPTFGVRRSTARRTTLVRVHETVQTPWGPVRIKLGSRKGRCLSRTPEYEDCRRIAAQHGLPLRDVIDAARRADAGCRE